MIDPEASLLFAVALTVAAAAAVGSLFDRIGQPRVVGELLAGVLLGPTLLGALLGDTTSALFSEATVGSLTAIGDLGLVLFMLGLGLDLDLRLLRRRRDAVMRVSVASLVVPFASGIVLAAWLYPQHRVVDGQTVSFATFAGFIALALSVTAFPILARIVADRQLQETVVGSLGLAVAAGQDAVGWLLLSLVLALAASESLAGQATQVVVLLSAMAALAVGTRLAGQLLLRDNGSAAGRRPLTAVLLLALVGGGVSHASGAHFVVGPFLVGVMLPREQIGALTEIYRARVAPLTTAVLLPVFFMVPGLRLDVGHLGPSQFRELAVVVAVACLAKFSSAAVAARLSGLEWREAASLGVLLNTRGLVEIVVLGIGLEHGILDERLFTLMVLMALVTTIMTGPCLTRLERRRAPGACVQHATRAGAPAEASTDTVSV